MKKLCNHINKIKTKWELRSLFFLNLDTSRANKLYASLEINLLLISKVDIFRVYRMMQCYEINGIFLYWDCINLKD